MTTYFNYEIERFEDEGGKTLSYESDDRNLEEIPVIDLLEDDVDARKEVQEHQES